MPEATPATRCPPGGSASHRGVQPAGADETIQHFLETSAPYGYWNASPEETARIDRPPD